MDLREVDFKILQTLHSHECLSIYELSRRLKRPKSLIYRHVEKLRRYGLVDIVVKSKSRSIVYYVKLTEKGFEILSIAK